MFGLAGTHNGQLGLQIYPDSHLVWEYLLPILILHLVWFSAYIVCRQVGVSLVDSSSALSLVFNSAFSSRQRLDNVKILCSTSGFLVPILSNFFLILVWPVPRCTTQDHCQSETNDRCVICPQTAPQLKVLLLRQIREIMTSQNSALFQHVPLACLQDTYPDNITSVDKYLGSSCVQTKNNVK